MSALVTLIVGFVLLLVVLKLALGLIGFALAAGVAVLVYFGAEKLVGKGR